MSRLWRVLGYGVLGAIVCFLGLMLLSLLNPYVYLPSEVQTEFDSIRTELPEARTRWRTHAITDYDVDVQVSAFCFVDVTLEVRNGHLRRMYDRDGKASITGLETLCAGTDLTPPAMFDKVEHNLSTFDPTKELMFVEFDQEFGYVRHYLAGTNSSSISHCCRRITYSNFRPISTAPQAMPGSDSPND